MSLHPINQYHVEVEKIIRFGGTAKETAIRNDVCKCDENEIVEEQKTVMNIELWVYGNHSIAFNGKEMSNKQEVLNRLNLLKLEDSEWLLEMCKQRHSPLGEEKWDRFFKEKLDYRMQIRSWRMTIEDDKCISCSNLYVFDGPFGLYIEISKYFVFIHPWVPQHHLWYWTENKENIEWRDTWRYTIYQIISALGGDSAMYFPDSVSNLSKYLPSKYNMKNFNQLVQGIIEKYTPCFNSFSEAARKYMDKELDNDPFVVDKFEDIENNVSLRIKS